MFRQPSGTVFARAKVLEESATEIVAHLSIIDDTGNLAATIDGFRCLRVAKSDKKRQDATAGFYRQRWAALPAPVRDAPARSQERTESWLILADRGGVGEGLARSIVEHGGQATLLFKGRRDRQIAEDRL